MKIKPLFDRIVIEEDKEETTISGIFIGGTNKDNIKTGTVICVGEGNDNNDGEKSKMYVQPGDKVIYSKFSGMETTLNKKNFFIIRQTDVLAIIEE